MPNAIPILLDDQSLLQLLADLVSALRADATIKNSVDADKLDCKLLKVHSDSLFVLLFSAQWL